LIPPPDELARYELDDPRYRPVDLQYDLGGGSRTGLEIESIAPQEIQDADSPTDRGGGQ
jgi:hypothetical protein